MLVVSEIRAGWYWPSLLKQSHTAR